MMITIDEESGEWRGLPESLLSALTSSVGHGALKFTEYRVRTRPQPGSMDGRVAPPMLHEGTITIEGHRYRAEYVVNGWKSEPNQQIDVEVIPLAWEDRGGSPVSNQELGSLTSAVVAAHQLVTVMIIDL
jgi:hypothetical protein